MSPLEKYIAKKNTDSALPEGLPYAQKGKERGERLQKKLEGFRTFQKEKYEKKKKEVIAKAIAEVKGEETPENDDFSKEDQKKMDRKNHHDRLRNYREAMSEQNDISVRDFAYAEISDFQFNQEVFRGEGGWLEEYNKTDVKDKQSLEEFVLEKQYAELEIIRSTLAEARVGELVPKLFKDLDGEEKKSERQKKTKEVNAAVKNFFSGNRKDVEELIRGEGKNADKAKQELFKKFREGVFPDITATQMAEIGLIQDLFDNLILDYSAMMDQKDYVKELNLEMVSCLIQDGITEEEWNERLAKSAEKKAKKLAENAKKKQQEDSVVTGKPVSPNFEKVYFSGQISTNEKMGEGSKITFVPTGAPGEFLVKFPSDSGEQESLLTVREVTENGRKREVYIFSDQFMDSKAIVGEKGFKGQVNGLFLDHVMNESIKHGKDYLGPNLNDVLHDKEMYNLAEQIFYPRKLDKAVIETKDVSVFRNLMQVLTNKTNNSSGEGIYGNLQAIRTRISLLQLALSLDGGNKAKSFYKILAETQSDKLKNLSIEELCKSAGVEKNNGNFAKT